MTDEQRYLFDLQGYIVLKNVVSQEVIAEVNQVMDWLEGLEPEDLPYGVSHGKPRTESELYLANMVEAHPVFHQFIDHPAVLPIISEITLGLYRLNHAMRYIVGVADIPICTCKVHRCTRRQHIIVITVKCLV